MKKSIFNKNFFIGLIFGVIGLYWAFQDFSFSEFRSSIKNVKLVFIFSAIIALWISIWLRGIRWKYLFQYNESIKVSSLYRAQCIGYFGNNILPVRIGELLKSYILSQEYSLPNSYVFGTVVLERILDLFSLAILSIVLLIIYNLPIEIKINIIILIMIILVLALIFFFLIKYLSKKQINYRIINLFIDGISGLRIEIIFPILLTSGMMWSIYWLDVYLIQKALGLNMTYAQSLLVLILSSISLSIPSAPGMIGTFHAGVKFTMTKILDYPSVESNSFAILLHSYSYIFLTILGLYYFIKSGYNQLTIKNIMSSKYNNINEK